MTDSFLILTILGLVIAIYSVLPEHKKLRIGYSFGKLEKVSLVVSGITIVGFSILTSFISLHSKDSYSPINKFSLNPLFATALVQVVAAIVILVTFLIKFLKKTVSIKNEKYLSEKVDELRYQQSYSCLAGLIEDNYYTIFHSGATKKKENLNLSSNIKKGY